MAGATSTLLYGVNLLFHPVNPPPPTEGGAMGGRPRVLAPYHLRVLVPCYKESLEIVAKTLTAALAAELPGGCSRTVYLLDDGKQRDKRKWCACSPAHVLCWARAKRRRWVGSAAEVHFPTSLLCAFAAGTCTPAGHSRTARKRCALPAQNRYHAVQLRSARWPRAGVPVRAAAHTQD